MKTSRLLSTLPVLFLAMSCSPEATTSDDTADREEVCALYRNNKISKDAALQTKKIFVAQSAAIDVLGKLP